ncbi:hypothetical protein [Methylococcus capsulatus]|uniref:Uncharacterized protein n=2 Tax=Methylococcus TaxID=413 RepID=A0ABZ2F904_METCP|nr:hypothetical protein [Methylococcus capsulatus]
MTLQISRPPPLPGNTLTIESNTLETRPGNRATDSELALSILLSAMHQGLLGLSDMGITGYDSNAYRLNWYTDRSGPLLPEPWVISVPLFAYRLLMLAWAL